MDALWAFSFSVCFNIRGFFIVGLVVIFAMIAPAAKAGEVVIKQNGSFAIASHAREIGIEIARHGSEISKALTDVAVGKHIVPAIKHRGGNLQVNDPSLDRFNFSVLNNRFAARLSESETSIAARGRTIVGTYNSSAFPTGTLLVSAFSTSLDGGQTWKSGFFPQPPGLISFTLGDPVIVTDRAGKFYFAGMALQSIGNCGLCLTIGVNTSTDGLHWSDGVVPVMDNGLDKPWMAVGPDPVILDRDNIYITYTHIDDGAGSSVVLTRSLDGGQTWDTPKTIFAPTADANVTGFIQGTATYVDPISGYVYVPFLHFGQSHADYIRILKSTDAGVTFTMVTFNDSAAPDAQALTITSPGEVTDCGAGNRRLTIHAGPATAPLGINRYAQAARLGSQPAFAARKNILYLAWANSENTINGDNDGSNVFLLRSDDGGNTWTDRIQVNPALAADKHHVMPKLALDHDPNDVHVAYWTQHTDETIDVDMANSRDGGTTFPGNRTIRVSSTNSVIPPTNITISPTETRNYDFFSSPCYNLGEYLDVQFYNGKLYLLWADNRNSVIYPTADPTDPLSGQTISQADVFFQAVQAH